MKILNQANGMTLNNALSIKLFSIITIIMLLQSCSKDPNDGCPDPFTTYYNNIDTINVPYKKNKLFVYKDQNGNLITTKIIKDTSFYNCILQPTLNPNCGTQNTNCYINKQYYFDTLANVRLDSEIGRLFIVFNNSNFYLRTAPLLNKQMKDYPYLDSIMINNKPYFNIRLITNSQKDSLFLNYYDGILKVINSNNIYSLN